MKYLLGGCVVLLLATGVPAEPADNSGGIIATTSTGTSEGFEAKPAVLQSMLFLGIQHGFRFATEPGSREELKGPFFRDWGRSVRGISGWGDGDTILVNYIGHPMMGSVTGYIQAQNDARGSVAEFGRSREYWRSRMRALAWTTAYSTQWELGAVSEASLGNVGKIPGTSGMVDFVITPLAGTGMMVAEDAVDRYVIARLESRSRNLAWRMIVRSLLNPDRAFANVLRWRAPWHRDTRPGITAP